jgi:hypothetical protein
MKSALKTVLLEIWSLAIDSYKHLNYIVNGLIIALYKISQQGSKTEINLINNWL